MFSGGAALGIVGGAIAWMRNVPNTIIHFLKRKTITSIEVLSDKGNLYGYMNRWLSVQEVGKNCRLSEAFLWLDNLIIVPAPGDHLTKFKGHYIWLTKSRKEGKAGNSKADIETIIIKSITATKETLVELIKEAINYDKNSIKYECRVYLNQKGYWEDDYTKKHIRTFNHVILDPAVKSDMINDLDLFLSSEDKYTHLGIPYRRGYGLFGKHGTGKAQPINSIVYTPSGPRKIGELRVNDYVLGRDGKPTKVLGIYPQGIKQTYKVFFSDGSSTRCCDDHLWYVESSLDKQHNRFGSVQTLNKIRRQILGRQTGDCINVGARFFKVPKVLPLQFDKKDLLFDPYIIGAMLGDGSFQHGPVITTMDPFIIEQIRDLLPGDMIVCSPNLKKGTLALQYRIRGGTKNNNRLMLYFREVGLNDKRSWGKFIPEEYKYSSVNDRIALLQGLMDTDGTVDQSGISVSYTTTSKRLADDFMFIVRSLGGTCSITEKIPFYTDKGNQRVHGRLAYTLSVCMPPDINPFRLPRKSDKVIPKSKYLPSHYIKNVLLDEYEECVCIKVEALDSLYVTDDCILTHNSTLSECFAERMKSDIYCISLSNKDMSDQDLYSLFTKIPKGNVVLLEDVDVAFTERTGDGGNCVTLSGLLNVLDGQMAQEGNVLVMTSNHPEKLDPALIRPGRIDRQFVFENASEYQAGEIFERFFPNNAAKSNFSKLGAGESMATLQNVLLMSENNSEKALELLREE